MIRQHKKNDFTHINYNAVSDFFIGLLLWNQLPDSLATHWGIK